MSEGLHFKDKERLSSFSTSQVSIKARFQEKPVTTENTLLAEFKRIRCCSCGFLSIPHPQGCPRPPVAPQHTHSSKATNPSCHFLYCFFPANLTRLIDNPPSFPIPSRPPLSHFTPNTKADSLTWKDLCILLLHSLR